MVVSAILVAQTSQSVVDVQEEDGSLEEGAISNGISVNVEALEDAVMCASCQQPEVLLAASITVLDKHFSLLQRYVTAY